MFKETTVLSNLSLNTDPAELPLGGVSQSELIVNEFDDSVQQSYDCNNQHHHFNNCSFQ